MVAKVESGMSECKKCKREVREKANFCPYCGQQLKANPVVVYYNQ